MRNVSAINDCYGCGVCAIVCPKHIISINLSQDGFYQPSITDVDSCVDCGLCLDVCSYHHPDLSLSEASIKSYGGWSKDSAVRRKCSSGGVGFEVGRTLLAQGYKVCGVRYNANLQRAEHYIASSVEELVQSIGSKYIQSYTVDGFKAINRKEKYLITGTPCQIDSFRRLIKKCRVEDNFVLMDFFCHGVPSMWMWKKYLKHVESITGPVTYASWRNKFTGWHDSWSMGIDGLKAENSIDWHGSYNMLIRGKKTYYNSRHSQGDFFYRLFLSDCCLGKACYDHCKFKYDQSSADIRIGDMWGTVYKNNEEGVSTAVPFTDKGHELLKMCNIELHEHPFELVAEGQMKTMPKRSGCYNKVMNLLKERESDIVQINSVVQRYNRKTLLVYMLTHPHYAIKYIIKKVIR